MAKGKKTRAEKIKENNGGEALKTYVCHVNGRVYKVDATSAYAAKHKLRSNGQAPANAATYIQ